MPLPPLPAWLIDYATARQIFSGNNAHLKNAVDGMCAAGTMKFCACEEPSFKGNLDVRKPFYDDQNCRCNLSGQIASIASELPDVVGGKKRHTSDTSVKMIVACAIHHNFGLVSYKVGMFFNTLDLGAAHGVTCLTLAQFAAMV